MGGAPPDADRRRRADAAAGGREAGPRLTAPKKKDKEAAGGNTSLDDEVSFRNPYPDDCRPIPQQTAPGAEPRYVAEVWWLIGDYHFNEVDPPAAPFNYNRAEAAYQQSIKFKKPPVHGVVDVQARLDLLQAAALRDERPRSSSICSATPTSRRRTPATRAPTSAPRRTRTSPARSRTSTSPARRADEPYIPRNDILDIETDPHIAEQKMRDRHRPRAGSEADPAGREVDGRHLQGARAGVPGAQPVPQHHRGGRAHPEEVADAPRRAGRAERDRRHLRQAHRAVARGHRRAQGERGRARSRRAPSSPPTSATRPGPTPTRTTPRRSRRPSASSTAGSAAPPPTTPTPAAPSCSRPSASATRTSRDPILERALTEYKLAAQGWDGYLKQDENAPDAYESRYWLADANHNVVVILVMLDRSPSPNEIDAARRTAIDVRDSNEDDKYLQPAAFMVVDTAQQVLNDQYKLFDRSHGAQGIEKRDAVKTTGEGDNTTVVKDPVPAGRARRRRGARRVHPARAAGGRCPRPREHQGRREERGPLRVRRGGLLLPLRAVRRGEAGGSSPSTGSASAARRGWGYKAWSRLIGHRRPRSATSPAAGSSPRSTRSDACADDRRSRSSIADLKARNIESGGYYIDAYAAYQKAEKMPDGPERVKQWREAGGALPGRAQERAGPRRGAGGRDQRRARLQADRRLRPGHRDVHLVHQGVRQRGEPQEAREGRPVGDAAQAAEPEASTPSA